MFLRIFSASLIAVTLSSCGGDATMPEPEGDAVECAIGPGTEFASVCTLEVTGSNAFVVHHPDGGFRRFVQSGDNVANIAVADGAESIISQSYDEASQTLEFSLEVDRYRFDIGLLTPASDD